MLAEVTEPRPGLALYLGDHNPRHVTDQIVFFLQTMRQQGYSVFLSRRLRPDLLNVKIEALTRRQAATLEAFSRDTGKRIGLIHTEHIEVGRRGLFLNHWPIDREDGYWDKGMRRQRLAHLANAVRYTRLHLRLGDLPALDGLFQLIGPHEILDVPFPVLRPVRVPEPTDTPRYDFAFTGSLTDYRKGLLTLLVQQGWRVAAQGLAPPHRRLAVHRKSRWVLDLPQHRRWTSISMMRVLASMALGCPTLAVKPGLGNAIDDLCIRVTPDLLREGLPRELVADNIGRYTRLRAAYDAMVAAQTGWPSIHAAVAEWAGEEGVVPVPQTPAERATVRAAVEPGRNVPDVRVV